MNTKNIINAFVLPLAAVLFTACEKIAIPRDEFTDSYNKVYLAAAARNPNEVTLKMADSTYKIIYGASYGGYGYPAQDIEVEFVEDAAQAAAFNLANNTSYPLLPASCYEFDEPSAIIPQGAVSTRPLAVKINPDKGMELFKEYLLAISIKNAGGAKLEGSMQTAYYIVKASFDFADFPDYDRSSWTVAGVSSEEPAEGETNGGLGIHAIDGQNSTFWHTKWDGGEAPPPHWIAIDMGETKTIHGLSFTGRQSSDEGKPNTVQVEVSDNGTDWTDAGTLTLANINAQQKFFMPSFPTGRYLRITVVSNFGNRGYTHLAELGAF